jgi:hypothetical protein
MMPPTSPGSITLRANVSAFTICRRSLIVAWMPDSTTTSERPSGDQRGVRSAVRLGTGSSLI